MNRPSATDLRFVDGRTRRGVVAVSVIAGLLSAGAMAHGEVLRRWLAGECDLAGVPRYEPDFPPDPARLARVDLEHVHAELLPAWAIAAAQPGHPGAAQALAALNEALAPDPNLRALSAELGARVARSPMVHARRVLWLVWAWSDYLDRAGAGWRLEGNVRITPDRAFFYSKSYHVVADLQVRVGQGRHRTRLLERADRTNVREGYLGHALARREGGLVLVDRVREFTMERVRPLLFGEPWRDANRRAAFTAHLVRDLTDAGFVTDDETLVARVARGVAVHEARHVADDDAGEELTGPAMPREALLELSAYLASFATPGIGYVCLLQACELEADRRTAHGMALTFLLPRIMPRGCAAGPPPDLHARAQALEGELLGRSERISLPAEFPERL